MAEPNHEPGGKNVRHIAGAMSGTSADGVDIAITRIAGRGLEMTAELVKHHHRPYSNELRKEIFAFRAGEVREDVLGRLARMGREISLVYATAVNETLAAASMNADGLAAVAAHGQTLFHDPPGTIQWFDPSLVAAEVGCAVVSDFRRADLAAGGQGAPLVPFADYILFRHPTKNRVLLNIGGIANITFLKAGGTIDEVIAFDTGPGNCISDYLCRKFDPEGPGMDVDGDLSAGGRAHANVDEHFGAASFFQQAPPKSTDGPAMIQIWNNTLNAFGKDLAIADLLATSGFVTASTIAEAIVNFLPKVQMEVIASGGGIKNKIIMGYLPWLLEINSHTFATLDQAGFNSDAKEAIAFALLGAATLDGVPSNVPSVTGARRAVVLGSITPRP